MGPGAFIAAFEGGDGAAIAASGVDLELSPCEGAAAVRIEGLMVPAPRRRGMGRGAMRALCGAADRAGIELRVVPEPVTLLVASPIPRSALERFYAGFGFSPLAGGEWSRRPRP